MNRLHDIPLVGRLRLSLLLLSCLLSGGCSAPPDAAGENWGDRFVRTLSATVSELADEQAAINSRLAKLPGFDPQFNLRAGFHSGYATSTNHTQWVQVDLGVAMPIDMIALVPASLVLDDRAVLNYGFPRQFRVEVAEDFDGRQSTLILDSAKQPVVQTGGYPLLIPNVNTRGRFVRVTCTELTSEGQQWFFALSELIVVSGNRNVAQWRPVASSGTVETDLRWSSSYLVDAISALPTPMGTARSPTYGFLSAPHDDSNATAWLEIDLGEVCPVDEVRLLPARPADRPDVPGWSFPSRFTVELRCAFDDVHEKPIIIYDCSGYELRHWLHSPLTIPVGSRDYFKGLVRLDALESHQGLPVDPIAARYVRINVTQLDRRSSPGYLALSEVQVYSRSKNVALGKPVSASDVASEGLGSRWSPRFVNDGFGSRHDLLEWPDWLRQIDERRGLEVRLSTIEEELDQATESVWQRVRWSLGSLLTVAIGIVLAIDYRLRRAHRRQTLRLRTEIASDLHDEIGSNLGTIALMCETLIEREMPTDQRESLSEIREIANETGDAMRDMVWIMHPESTRLDDFVGRLRHTAHRMLPSHEVVFDCPLDLPQLTVSLSWRRNVFLSVKELIHNIAKHATSTAVEVRIRVAEHCFQVTISDNGTGFQHRLDSQGLGIKSVRRRLEQLGGKMAAVSVPNRGTTTTIEVPLP